MPPTTLEFRPLTRVERIMKSSHSAPLLVLSAFVVTLYAAQPDWQPAQGPLITRWGRDVSPKNAHPEYPRPQMVRKEWLNLNGLWDYAIRPKAQESPATFDGKIRGPC